MAKFTTLVMTDHYDIIDAETGHPLTESIRGVDAMARQWPKGAEAWPAGETKFIGKPVELSHGSSTRTA